MRKLGLSPAHAVCINPKPKTIHRNRSWVGAYPNEGLALMEHIKAAVLWCAENPDAVFMPSGGATKARCVFDTEALSYIRIAQYHSWWGHPEVSHRKETEDNATDSMQNLLFGLLLFKHRFGHWPEETRVFGWAFKQQRYEIVYNELTRLGVFAGRFTYVPVNDPVGKELVHAQRNEAALIKHMLSGDPLLRAQRFQDLRKSRDPFGVYHPYGRTKLPAFRKLIDWLETPLEQEHGELAYA